MNAAFHAATVNFYPQSNLVVTGTNPEMADISNPRGEIIEELWFVVAANEAGDVRESRSLGTGAAGRAAAERAATALSCRAESLGKLPVNFENWREGRPQYGSSAYLCYGMADDLAWERSCG